MHHTIESLTWTVIGNGWKRATLELAAGDSAENPASTTRSLYGPAHLVFERAPSHAITVYAD